ncbi:MAG: hypothetical protein PHX51_04575 [Clostridia bacterium]|nr:hypothetical protein [Clostridia bacterium]
MKITDYIIPVLFIGIMAIGLGKKTNVYNAFVKGAGKSLRLVGDLFPYIFAVFLAIGLFKASGLSSLTAKVLTPVLVPLGVPVELTELIVLKNISGSGSLAVLGNIFKVYGADSYIGRCASIIMSSTETTLYIAGIYFADTKVKRIGKPLAIGLLISTMSVFLSCWLCKII